jgi:hypothetical protein
MGSGAFVSMLCDIEKRSMVLLLANILVLKHEIS